MSTTSNQRPVSTRERAAARAHQAETGEAYMKALAHVRSTRPDRADVTVLDLPAIYAALTEKSDRLSSRFRFMNHAHDATFKRLGPAAAITWWARTGNVDPTRTQAAQTHTAELFADLTIPVEALDTLSYRHRFAVKRGDHPDARAASLAALDNALAASIAEAVIAVHHVDPSQPGTQLAFPLPGANNPTRSTAPRPLAFPADAATYLPELTPEQEHVPEWGPVRPYMVSRHPLVLAGFEAGNRAAVAYANGIEELRKEVNADRAMERHAMGTFRLLSLIWDDASAKPKRWTESGEPYKNNPLRERFASLTFEPLSYLPGCPDLLFMGGRMRTPGFMHHDGAVYLAYGTDLTEEVKELADRSLWEECKASEWYAAKEAMEDADREAAAK